MDLSPDSCKAGMFGLYYLIRDVFVAVAALGGAFLWQISPQTNLMTAFVFGIIGTAPSLAHVVRVFLVCLGLWAVVAGTVWASRGLEDVLTQIVLFFTKAAFVTFGGAYAVLSYITDVAVGNGWLITMQMLIGLGLAESTPGPLIMVTQYVGFLGAWNLPGDLTPLAAGILGALITTYVTFLPCFFFIFAGAPFIEAMAGNQRLQAALTGVTAAVVGVVLNLAVWFGHKVILPESGIDLFAVISIVVSLVLRRKVHMPIHYLVPMGAAAGVIWRVVF
jgi:chromate transporter